MQYDGIRRRCAGAVIVAVLWGLSAPVSAEDAPVTTAPLLVLLAAKDPDGIEVERRLVGELRLTLDSLQVEQVVIEREDFLDLTLPEQLAVVQPLIRRLMARAVVWVTVGTNGGRLVQFVVTDRGNSTIRTVEAGSAEELALAVRELLDTAYLFEPKQKKDGDVLDERFFSLGAFLSLSGGLYGHEGSSLCGGMGLGGRFAVWRGFFVGLGAAFNSGPAEKQPDGLLSGRRVDARLSLGYLFNFGRFGIGPAVELSAIYSVVDMVLGGLDDDRYSWWSFRGAAGLTTRLRLTEVFALSLGWTVGGISGSRAFERTSNGATVLATPIVDYAFSFGFVIGIL